MAAASTPMLSAVLIPPPLLPVITGGSGSVGASTALDDVCGGMGGYYVTPELCVLCSDPSSRRVRGQARGGGQHHRSQRQHRGLPRGRRTWSWAQAQGR